jgi:cell division protein FtsA
MTLLGGRTGFGSMAGKRSGIVTVLDVGSTKVSCMIARLTPRDESAHLPGRTHKIEVLGIGHQRSRGVKSGVVVELDNAEAAIRQVVDAAERMAGLTVDSIITSVSAGRIKGSTISATVSLGNRPVDDGHIGRVMSAATKRAQAVERKVLHVLPVSYSLDAEKGIRDPRGMEGSQLGLDVHVVTADAAPLRNLELCVNRAHLSIESMVATPYASGLSVLVDDEAELGAACIDLGGGTTTIGIFAEGRCIHTDAIAIGGNHVTMDLARGLSTRLEDAEALKARFGTVLVSAADEQEMISVRPISGDPNEELLQIPRSMLTRIVKARVEETLELLRDRINQSGFGNVVGKRVVDRWREPAAGIAGGGASHIGTQCARREAARCRWPAGNGQGTGLCGQRRPFNLPAGCGIGTGVTGLRLKLAHDRNRWPVCPRRAVAEGQFLTKRGDPNRYRRRRYGTEAKGTRP